MEQRKQRISDIQNRFSVNFSNAQDKFRLTDDDDDTPSEDPLDIYAYLNNKEDSESEKDSNPSYLKPSEFLED